MISDIDVSILFHGESFSPNEAERLTGLKLSDKNERGDIGTKGRYIGNPLPDGQGTLRPPPEINIHDRLIWVATALKGTLNIMMECGAESPYIHVGYFYKDQANFSLSKEEISALKSLDIDLWFSCYDGSDDD